MVEVSFINPLSNEGRQIVKEYGDLNKLFDEDETLVNEIAPHPTKSIVK